MVDRWLVVVSGPELIEEVRKLPDDKASFMEAIHEVYIMIDIPLIRTHCVCSLHSFQFFQFGYSLGDEIATDPIHADVVRGPLTRHIAVEFAEIHDEIRSSFSDLIPVSSSNGKCLKRFLSAISDSADFRLGCYRCTSSDTAGCCTRQQPCFCRVAYVYVLPNSIISLACAYNIPGRNEDWLGLAINHTKAVARTREVMTLFPYVLKPLVLPTSSHRN